MIAPNLPITLTVELLKTWSSRFELHRNIRSADARKRGAAKPEYDQSRSLIPLRVSMGITTCTRLHGWSLSGGPEEKYRSSSDSERVREFNIRTGTTP